jgi:hypothetical protein
MNGFVPRWLLAPGGNPGERRSIITDLYYIVKPLPFSNRTLGSFELGLHRHETTTLFTPFGVVVVEVTPFTGVHTILDFCFTNKSRVL